MKIIGGSASSDLAGRLAGELNANLVATEVKRFPDDEAYVRVVDDITGEDVVLVQSAYPDRNIVELFLWQDALADLSVKSLRVIIPYLGYARQDKAFLKGEAVSIRALANLIQTGASEMYTVDAHSKGASRYFDVRWNELSAAPALAGHLKSLNIDSVLAPDKGALEHAKRVADLLNCESDYLEKKRIDSHTVEVSPKSLDAGGKVVAIVDDIISTGGTIVKATEQLREHGAKTVIAGCTHGLFVADALEKLKVCDEVFSTDTLMSPVSKVTVAGVIAEALGAQRD
ncbi:MAG: ribose-phosphate diphosphokinase [Thermoplasmata archaeon]